MKRLAQVVQLFIADGTAYKGTRSLVSWVIDKKYKDAKGEPIPLTKAVSAIDCQNTPGTWFTDNASVWIHRQANEAIDSDILMLLNSNYLNLNLNGKRLVLDGVRMFYNYYTTGIGNVKITGNVNSTLYAKNTVFAYGGGNGLENINVGKTFLFGCKAYKNGTDGFNYHETPASASPFGFVFEFDCEGFENGNRPGRTQGINNGSTAHDGVTTLRIRSKAWKNEGPNIADVNGCLSVLMDCLSYDSIRPAADNVKSAYYFDTTGALKTGKAYLINSIGGGVGTHSIGSDGLIDVYVRDFKGRDIVVGAKLNHI